MTKKSEITNETAQKHFEVDVRNIKPLNKAGGNLRNDYGEKDGSFDELVANIKENGIIMPLRAFRDSESEGGWIAIDGHTRLKAAMVYGVCVGKEYAINHPRLIILNYHLPFDKPSKITPDFASMANYDLKAWEYCLKYKSTNDVLFWNVL